MIIAARSFVQPSTNGRLLPAKFAKEGAGTGKFRICHREEIPINVIEGDCVPLEPLAIVLAKGRDMLLKSDRRFKVASDGPAFDTKHGIG